MAAPPCGYCSAAGASLTAPAASAHSSIVKRLAALALAAALALVSCLTTGAPQPAPARLQVMSWNAGDATGVVPSADAVVEVLGAAGWQDVYLLQEVLTAQRAEALRDGIASSGGGTYHLAYSERLAAAVLSRAPLAAPLTFVAPSSPLGRGALLVRAAAAGGAVTLVDVHLDPIPKRRDARGRVDMRFGGAVAVVLRETLTGTARSAAAAELLAWLEATVAPGAGERLVIGGDFNTVPSSRTVRLMSERFVDAAAASAAASGRPLRGTYRRVRFPLRPRVDFIFVSPALAVLDARTLRLTPGDHYPVLATLEVAP